jgi:type 1 fimbria pilin
MQNITFYQALAQAFAQAFAQVFAQAFTQDKAEVWNIHISGKVVAPQTRCTVSRGRGKM